MCKTNSVPDFFSPHLLFPQIHTNTLIQTNQHRDTQKHPHKQTNREREIGVGVGHLWISGLVLVVEIRVCGLMEMGLNACGSVLAVEIGACGSTEVGFDACGLVLAAEIGACGF